MKHSLELKFLTSQGRTSTLTINDPKPDLTEEEVRQAMQAIQAEQMFVKDGVSLYHELQSAHYVSRQVVDVFNDKI